MGVGETTTDYVIRAEIAATSLKAAGEVISDGLLVAMTLKGLPTKYKTFLGKCFKCGRKGHKSVDCYSNKVLDRPIPIVLVKCWKVANWNAKKLLKNCQKSKKLLPKFQEMLPQFLAIFI